MRMQYSSTSSGTRQSSYRSVSSNRRQQRRAYDEPPPPGASDDEEEPPPGTEDEYATSTMQDTHGPSNGAPAQQETISYTGNNTTDSRTQFAQPPPVSC